MSISDGESAGLTAPGATNPEALASRLGALGKTGASKGPPPVHLWNPPYCGELDIRISRDGVWFYLGTQIRREPLVRLFASVLRRDDDGKYYLVTPAEKIGIRVDDVPFVALDVEPIAEPAGPALAFETNVGDVAVAGPDNPIRIERDAATGEPSPYILIRGRLEARIDRKTFYRLVDLGAVARRPDGEMFGVWSRGAFFALAAAEDVGMAGATTRMEESR